MSDEKEAESFWHLRRETDATEAMLRDAQRLLGENPDILMDWGRCSLGEVAFAFDALLHQAADSWPSAEERIGWLTAEVLLRLAAGRLSELLSGAEEARRLAARCEEMADRIGAVLRAEDAAEQQARREG